MEVLTYTVLIIAGELCDLRDDYTDRVTFAALSKKEAFNLADKAMLQGHLVAMWAEIPEDS